MAASSAANAGAHPLLDLPDTAPPGAWGAVLGGAVGDALGAVLEFRPGEWNDKGVEAALTLPGGGVHGVGRGQVTDDTEMALALARGLAANIERIGDAFPANAVARAYGRWKDTAPFDLGGTIRAAVGVGSGSSLPRARARVLGGLMAKAAAKRSGASKSNGALMRAAPLGLRYVPAAHGGTAAVCAAADAALTHPNPVCVACNGAFVEALAVLVTLSDDDDGRAGVEDRAAAAWAAARDWLISAATDAADEVLGWMDEASVGVPASEDVRGQAGYVRWAFTAAFAELAAGTSFRAAMQRVLGLGGDTDTNAAIVGALIGALHGVGGDSGIPREWTGTVLKAKHPRRVKRPRWLHPVTYLELVPQLWAGRGLLATTSTPSGRSCKRP